MRLGVGLPHYGGLADPASIGTFAAHAEKVGYESLWVGDRVLTPLEPSDLYPGGTPERPYPPQFTKYVDPLVALTVAATATERIRLGSSTLIGTLHSPVLLARTLTSLDLVSRGRLDVGLGIGWMRSEYAAVGVPWAARGKRLEELMDALVAMWTGDPVAHEGPLWQIPPSQVDLRPAQRPHPPLLLGAHTEAALERVGRKADGWLPAGRPLEVMAQQWDVIRTAADRAGREPGELRRILRLNPRPGVELPDVAAQLAAAREAGIEEAFVDLHFIAASVAEATERADELFALVARG